MHASHAGRGRPSAVENVRVASTAKIFSSCAYMGMANGIEPKSECMFIINVSRLTSVSIDNLVVWPAGSKSASSFSKISVCVLQLKTKP